MAVSNGQQILYGASVDILHVLGMWKTIFLSGLGISVCLGLSGFIFEDNLTSKRWVKDNGEITHSLPRWYENIGYVQFVEC